jgi:Uma2 family endonuclease
LADSEPEPDISVFPGPESRYGDGNPNGRDVRLVIEIADSSLVRDQGIKLQMYARGGICEYWIIDVPSRQVWRYAAPRVKRKSGVYEDDGVLGTGKTLRLHLSRNEMVELPVDDIFRVLQ